MKTRRFTWYLEPKDSHTNKVVSESPGISEENFHKEIMCADGNPHNLCECPVELMYSLVRSASQLNLKFRIWGKEGNGKIYDKTNWVKSKINKIALFRKIS